MMTECKDIRVVEYDHSHAKAVADMWNRSRDSWGGGAAQRTEQSIISEHDAGAFLHVFLAYDRDEVVGYCSFSRYMNDDNALYVATLNVRPDYHGKKVGKQLVLLCVEKTIEMGYPRVDLFTWPGNTKAVPLYKKCGFFWEDRDDTTHLMNFIPYVLGTEAVSDFFQTADWYADSKRTIEVKPDGRKENKFDFFEYLWEKDGKSLRMEFERTGRGIRLIETDDYRISASIDNHSLAFGRTYKITYDFVNKSGKELTIDIRGMNDKNISFSMEHSLQVADKNTVTGEFRVGDITENQNLWRTHPGVTAELLINGKKAVFKIGIQPVFPASIFSSSYMDEYFLNSPVENYINIENNFNEEARFEFTLPAIDGIAYEDDRVDVQLGARKKTCVQRNYRSSRYMYENVWMPVKATLGSGETVEFKTKLNYSLKGYTGDLTTIDDNSWSMLNGIYTAGINKHNNSAYLTCHNNDFQGTGLSLPKLGKPYTSEFCTERPVHVDIQKEEGAMVLRARYISKEFPGMELIRVIQLYAEGILKTSYEVINTAKYETEQDIELCHSIHIGMYRGIIPYDHRYMEFENAYSDHMGLWEEGKLTENWIFSKGDTVTRGICWEKGINPSIMWGGLCFEHNFGRLKPGQTAVTPVLTTFIDTFRDWKKFRDYALGQYHQYKPLTHETFECVVNEGNPFIGRRFDVAVMDHKNIFFDGEIELSSEQGNFMPMLQKFSPEDKTRDTVFHVALDCTDGSSNVLDGTGSRKSAIDRITLAARLNPLEFEMKKVFFPISAPEVHTRHEIQALNGKEMNIWEAGNGLIQMKSSPEFFDGLYSLSYLGNEWLDTSFPTPGPKSWWNPFTGGLHTQYGGLSAASLAKEKVSATTVQLVDNKGNIWGGIKTTVVITENEGARGLTYHQYFLLLPGVPVVCCVTEVNQDTGFFFNRNWFHTECFLKPDEKLENCSVLMRTYNHRMLKVKAGKDACGMGFDGCGAFCSNNRDEKLTIYTNADRNGSNFYVSNMVVNIGTGFGIKARCGETVFSQPFFLIFTDTFLEKDELRDLNNIQFA